MICVVTFAILALIILALVFLIYKKEKNLKILNFYVNNLKEEVNFVNQQKLEVERKLESRTALLIDVSHELRSPLHGIVILSETLSTKWQDLKDDDKHEYVTSIFDASIKLTQLVNHLLDFSKFDAGKMVFDFGKLDLIENIEEVIKYCRSMYLFNGNIAINFYKQDIKEAFILGDSPRINQLITNLLINAIKHTDLGAIDAQLDYIQHEEDDYWKFTLIDSGTGILSKDLESIFEPFIQGALVSSNVQAGSGLGLTTCKQIVEAHQGKIWAENNQIKGAKFSFIIPIYKDIS
ncbi:MAG: HAMP domain-containing histidine kinase [Rickettsiaceae bacterium]|nr:MAG: HAMP domain-containing histidine kinase [Rickettsiaceae bacterium]